MRYTYDDEADALYVHLREDVPVARSVIVDDARVVDLDRSDAPVGIEVVEASRGVVVRDLIDRFGLERFAARLAQLEGLRFVPVVRS